MARILQEGDTQLMDPRQPHQPLPQPLTATPSPTQTHTHTPLGMLSLEF